MAAIHDQLMADLKKAMLAKDVVTRDTIRMVKADLTNRELQVGRALDAKEETEVLQRAVKSRRDSIEQYEAGGRAEAAAAERAEIAVVQAYLPQALSELETSQAIVTLIKDLGLSGKKDMGRLMKELKAKHGAALDGRLASKLAGPALEP